MENVQTDEKLILDERQKAQLEERSVFIVI